MPEVIVTLSDTSITVTENVNTVTVYPERGITGNTGAKGDKGAKGDAGGPVAYLDDLIDVAITSVQNKDVIRYDTKTGNWINTALLTDLSGVITSSNSVTTITSQTGTGTKFVVDTSPTLITPNLGTPSAGVLTNCTFPTLNQNTTGTSAGLSTTLIVGKGGTGLGTLTANNVILGAGTSAVTFVAPGTKGNVRTSDGTTWKSAASAGGGGLTNLDGGSANSVYLITQNINGGNASGV